MLQKTIKDQIQYTVGLHSDLCVNNCSNYEQLAFLKYCKFGYSIASIAMQKLLMQELQSV